ncbi:MAG: MCP four helix bundle domain-containing protein, partial [Sulfurimonas sp.]|nr:MCP four helix bundle domain-containing protein [Sulfurimonas sp.]
MRAYTKSNRNIIISFIIVMLLVLGLGMVSIIKIIELSDLTKKFYDHPFTVTTSTYKIQKHLVSMHRYMKDVVLSHNEDELALAVNRVNDDEKAILKEFNIIFNQYLGNKREIKTTYNLFIAWKEIRKEVISLMHQSKQEEAIELNQNRAYSHANKVIESAEVLTKYASNKASLFVQDAKYTKELA